MNKSYIKPTGKLTWILVVAACLFITDDSIGADSSRILPRGVSLVAIDKATEQKAGSAYDRLRGKFTGSFALHTSPQLVSSGSEGGLETTYSSSVINSSFELAKTVHQSADASYGGFGS